MKKYILFFGVLLVISFVFLVLSKNNPTEDRKNKVNPSISDALIVSPQVPDGKVIVSRVKLSRQGFVVVREIEGNQLSQVVEISKPLDSGIHTNIVISLGSADVKNKDLVVMIYEDYGNDGFFNDFDQPMVDAGGHMTASYVTTGKVLSENITEAEPKEMMMDPNMKGMKHVVIVRYTDNGFNPTKVEVPVGSMVQFINESNKQMWVASTPHPQHTDLPTFDQFKPYGKGAVYRYVFDKKGTWGFHDHINPSLGGVVTVL